MKYRYEVVSETRDTLDQAVEQNVSHLPKYVSWSPARPLYLANGACTFAMVSIFNSRTVLSTN